MSYSVLDSATAAARAAATDQEAQLQAVADAFAGDVRLRYYSAAGTLLTTVTHSGTFIIDTGVEPREAYVGPYSAETFSAGGTAAYVIASVPAGADILRADVSLAAAVASTRRTNLGSTSNGAGLVLVADSGLPISALPAWRVGLTPLTWYEVGGNTLHDIRPTNDPAVNPNHPSTAPWAASGAQATIITDWGGGAWDETNQRLWVAGGGHSAYYGNEPYTIDLDADSPVWVMRGYPTGSTQRQVTTVAARDGTDTDVGQDLRPLSTHTYGHLAVLGNGRLFLGGQGGFCFDSSGTAVAEFDPTTDDWDMATGRYTYSAGDVGVKGGVEYDATRNKVWQVAETRVSSWNCTTKAGALEYQAVSNGVTGGTAVRRMPDHDLIAVFSGNSNSLGTGKHVMLVDPSDPGSAPTGINATTQDWGGWGIAYDTTRGRFLGWNGGGSVATLTPPATSPASNAWTYGSVTTSTSVATPSAAQANGTFGRVAYSELYDCLIVINGTQEPLYVLPLS